MRSEQVYSPPNKGLHHVWFSPPPLFTRVITAGFAHLRDDVAEAWMAVSLDGLDQGRDAGSLDDIVSALPTQ